VTAATLAILLATLYPPARRRVSRPSACIRYE
jgi:hypothetical protein